jgi:hypothetical protein
VVPWRVLAVVIALTATPRISWSQTPSCPDGTFSSGSGDGCANPRQQSDLPLDDELPMKFEALQVGLGTTWIQATGTITRETPEDFARFVENFDTRLTDVIFMHSPGGNLAAGLELGRKIRRAGFRTTIGRTIGLDSGSMDVYSYPSAYCFSACAYAFLGGVTRSFADSDFYGLHRFTSRAPISSDDAQVATSYIAAYLEDMGVSQRVLQLASRVASDDIAPLVPEAAEELGIIYDGSGRTKFRIERLGQSNVALFETEIGGRRLGGMVACGVDGTPTLVVSELDGDIPEALKRALNFRVEFSVSENQPHIGASVSYLENSSRDGMPTMIFAIPGLKPEMLERRFGLFHIWNPSVPDPTDMESYRASIRWNNAVDAFSFFLSAENSTRVLPVVLDGCSAAQPQMVAKPDRRIREMEANLIVENGLKQGLSWEAIGQKLIDAGFKHGAELAEVARQNYEKRAPEH